MLTVPRIQLSGSYFQESNAKWSITKVMETTNEPDDTAVIMYLAHSKKLKLESNAKSYNYIEETKKQSGQCWTGWTVVFGPAYELFVKSGIITKIISMELCVRFQVLNTTKP